jgi:prevent-host-death family protein
MRVAVTNAKGQLTDLIRRAEAGEEVVLTRHGHAVVRLVAIKAPIDRPARRRLLEEVQASAAAKATTGEPAARSQDFLYDEQGLPRCRLIISPHPRMRGEGELRFTRRPCERIAARLERCGASFATAAVAASSG